MADALKERRSLEPRRLAESGLVGWGERIGAEVETPLWIALLGPLGVGKSVLGRAIIRGAGVSGPVPSPSFTLVQSYESPRGFEIHHVDLYRLQPGDSLGPLGWEELLRSPGLVLVEWADRAGDQLPGSRWEVSLDYAETAELREVSVRCLGGAPEPPRP